MKALIKKTCDEAMLDIAREYLEQGGQEPFDLDALAEFAIRTRRWTRHGDIRKQLCKKDFSRAFQKQRHTDAQGRQVRTYLAVKDDVGGEQRVFWADVHRAQADYMHLAFHQRRNQIAGGCRQLKADVDSFNENRAAGNPYQLELNFTDEVAELEQPTTYQQRRRKPR